MKPTADDYEQYKKCIYSLVHTWVKKSPFSFDELLSEANLGFLRAVETYDLTKAGFPTHLYITVNGRLSHFVCKKKVVEDELDEWLPGKGDNPEQALVFKELVHNLSTEAREVVEVVLNTPREMIELVRDMTSGRQGKMHLYRSNVTKFYRKRGWSYNKINAAYQEIKNTFNWG